MSLDTTFRSTSPGDSYTRTGSYLTPSTTTFSRALTQTGTNTRSYTDTATFTNTRTSITPPSTLHRPQTISRSPLTSVRNIVALWKERTPTFSRPSAKSSVAGSMTSASPPGNSPVGFGRPPRLDETNGHGRDLPIPPKRDAEATSIRSVRSAGIPPVFDAEELSPYTQSNEAVSIPTLPFFNRAADLVFTRDSRSILVCCGTSMSMLLPRIDGKDAKLFFILTCFYFLGSLLEEDGALSHWIC